MSATTTKSRPASGDSAPRRSAMDPRISQRRRDVSRQQGRRRFWVLLSVVIVVAVVLGGWLILHLPWFSAKVVTVSGAVHETPAQVIAAGGLDHHPALLGLNTTNVANRIERLPWVSTATVKVAWPDRVHVVVTEAAPAAQMKTTTGAWALLAANGRVLATAPTQILHVVVLNGPAAPAPTATAVLPRDLSALEVAATLPMSFKAQVASVNIEPAGWIQLTMTTPLTVDIGQPSQLASKYEDVSSILAGATLHSGDVIDVSVPDAPTVSGG